MHSINIREIVRNSIDGGSSPAASCRYGLKDSSSSNIGDVEQHSSVLIAGGSGPQVGSLLPSPPSILVNNSSNNGNNNNSSSGNNSSSISSSASSSSHAPNLQSSVKGKRKRSTHEDPMSHRIIEKRRRDRMNNCLADLSRLIPSSYSKKERGRIEKTEIIEMAIRHLKNIQSHCTCGIFDSPEIEHSEGSSSTYMEKNPSSATLNSNISYFKLGYDECSGEVVNFLVESEGFYVGDSLCVRLTRHLGKNFGVKYKGGNFKRNVASRMSSSSSSGYGANAASSSSSDTGSNGRGYPRTTHNELPTDIYGHKYSYSKGGGERHSFGSSSYSIPETSVDNSNMKAIRSSWSHNLKSTQYKFKSNMHERFSHQRPHDFSDSAAKRPRKMDELLPIDYSTPFSWTPLRRNGGEESLFKPYSHTQSPLPSPRLNSCFQGTPSVPRSNVPIFALHPKEGYYMALSIDSSLIDPYLIFFTQIDKVSLHPITISVNFCGPMTLAFGSYNNNSNNNSSSSSSSSSNHHYHLSHNNDHNALPPLSGSQSSSNGSPGQKNENESSSNKNNNNNTKKKDSIY